MRNLAWIVIGTISLCGVLALAQEDVKLLRDRRADERPTLLIVGSLHFANPGRDVVNIEVEDVLTEARQAEIAVVVRELASLDPTHVAVEAPSGLQEAIDIRYRNYLASEYELSRNEIDQLGLRLAAEVGLDRVHAIDWNERAPGDAALYAWWDYADAPGQAGLVSALFDPLRNAQIPTLEGRSVAQLLLDLNKPEQLADMHRTNFDIARVGDDEVQAGANWVGGWYSRNLRIFNRIVEIAESPEDLIVVVYGAGHGYLLRRFAEESGAFTILDVESVLTDDRQ